MKISVVIPFYNAEAHLPRCLEALLGQTFKDAEYILVDNASSDSSAAVVSGFLAAHPDFPGQLLREDKKGAGAARNKGTRSATGEWIAFTDADCIPDPGWLSDMSKETDQPAIGAVAGQILPFPAKNIIGKFLGTYTLPPNSVIRIFTDYTLLEGGFPTSNLMVRRSVFEKIEGFDESIPIYGEDHDLCDRIYRTGLGISALTDGIVRHNHRSTLQGLVRQSVGFGESHAYMLKRRSPGALIITLPFIEIVGMKANTRIWMDFARADKKLLLALLLGLYWSGFAVMALLYFLYLCFTSYNKAKIRKIDVSPVSSPLLVFLLIIKSASITWGEIKGSFKYKVVCF